MRMDWWTLALQTVNVLILVLILGKFLFRPVVGIIDQRRQAAAKFLSDAERAKKEAIVEREAAEVEMAKIAAGRDAALRQADAEVEIRRAAALAAAREETDRMRAAAEHDMHRARLAERSAASDRSALLAVDITRRLLERLPDSARVEGFIEGLAEALGSLPEASRDRLGGADKPRLLAARSLTPAQTQACRNTLSRALGRPLDFDVAVDPDIIAGLELETLHAIVRNSFRADLSRIVDELTTHGVHS